MPLPVAALAGLAGSLLGGGTTSQTQNTTVNNSNSNVFNPTIVFGGDSAFNPDQSASNDFAATTVATTTQEQPDAAGILGGLTGLPTGITGGGISASDASQLAALSIGATNPNESALQPLQAGFPVELLALGAVGVIGTVLFTSREREA